MTTTTTRRPRKTTRKADPKFVWQEGDVTMTDPPTRQGHPLGTPEDPHNPTVKKEASEAPKKEASAPEKEEAAQPATPESKPEKGAPKGPQPHTLEVRFAEADKVPRHFWSSLGADGGSAIAKAHGFGVQANGKSESLILTGAKKADLDKAHKQIVKVWTDAVAASKVWRDNPEYKAASTQERWKMLNDFLRTYAHDVADVAS